MSDHHMQIGETAKEQYLMKWLQGVQALAMLSAATYAATIMHEWGYAHYWGTPDLFVRLTPALIVEHSFLKAVGWLAIAVVTHYFCSLVYSGRGSTAGATGKAKRILPSRVKRGIRSWRSAPTMTRSLHDLWSMDAQSTKPCC
jgi:hypothetical protein